MGVRVYPMAPVMRDWLDLDQYRRREGGGAIMTRRLVPVSGNLVANLVMILLMNFPYLAKVTILGKFDRYGHRPFPATA